MQDKVGVPATEHSDALLLEDNEIYQMALCQRMGF
jgi:hypothetical protein